MFTFVPKKCPLAAAAVAAALACGSASPAAAFSSFGFNQPTNEAPRHYAAQYYARPFDGGGSVFDYDVKTLAANRSARRIVIAGVCASACTMKLGARNACVTPDATLLFHQANYNGFRSELGTRVMLYAYPPRIRQWVLRNGALNSSSLTELSGRQAIAIGVRAC